MNLHTASPHAPRPPRDPASFPHRTLPIATLLIILTLTACTPGQVQQVIGLIQIGLNTVTIIIPALGMLSPAAAVPVQKYLALATRSFAEVAKILQAPLKPAEKAAAITAALSELVAQDPTSFLPANVFPELVARVKTIAATAKAISDLFYPPRLAAPGPKQKQIGTVNLTPAQTAQLNSIQAQAKVLMLALKPH